MGVGTENQNIWTEGKGFSVPLAMKVKGAEELNAKGCNPRHAGKKAERRNAVTDVEGQGDGTFKNYERIQSAREYDMPGIKHNNYKPVKLH